MNSSRGPEGLARGLFSKIAEIVRECNEAQRRMAVIRNAPDRFAARPDDAPDTYAEFLFRTSAPLQHEPSARAALPCANAARRLAARAGAPVPARDPRRLSASGVPAHVIGCRRFGTRPVTITQTRLL